MRLRPEITATEGGSGIEFHTPALAPRAPRVRLAYLLMLASSFFFAAMSACARAAGEQCDWRIPAFARAALVFFFAALLARVTGIRLVWLGPRTLWVRSITGSVSMLLTFYALTHLQLATTITLTNTFPLWVTVLAWPVLRHRPTLGVAVALVSGIAGVVLIERPERGEFRWASLCALTAAFCTAVVMLGLHRLKQLYPLVIVVHFSAIATGIIGAFVLWTGFGRPLEFAPLAQPRTLALLLGIGILGTAGQIFMTAAFRIALPQRLSVIGLVQVLFALGFDELFWRPRFEPTLLLGIVLIVAPVAWLLMRRGRGAV